MGIPAPLGPPPKMDPPNINFTVCLAQTRAPVLFFDINRYNRQIFRHSLTVPPLWGPPQGGPPKIKFLHDQIYDACVFDISRYFRGKYFDRVALHWLHKWAISEMANGKILVLLFTCW